MPLATEAWPAVFGGLIPILGLAAIAYLIHRAVKDDDNDETTPSDQANQPGDSKQSDQADRGR